MTKSETIKILIFLNCCYGNKFKYPCKTVIETAALEETWLSFLHNFSYTDARKAVKSLCLQNPTWPPTSAEVAHEIISFLDPNEDMMERYEKALSEERRMPDQ